jgi:hypothetical protein
MFRLPVFAAGVVLAAIAFSSEALAWDASNFVTFFIDWKIFFLGIITLTFFYFSLAYTLGRQVLNRKWNVHYTRKILQPCLFLIPMILTFQALNYLHEHYLSPFVHFNTRYKGQVNFGDDDIEKSQLIMGITGALVAFWVFAFAKPLRARIKFLNIAFAAIGEHENDNSALIYLITEIVVSYIIVLIYMYYSFAILHVRPETLIGRLYIPLFVSGIGAPLATIIGTRYRGRIYKDKALLTDKTYTASLEGSLCIFLSAVLIITLLFFSYPGVLRNTSEINIVRYLSQYLAMIAIIPLSITVAEAKSPLGLKNSFIFVSAFVSIWASFWLAPILFDVMSPFVLFCIKNW